MFLRDDLQDAKDALVAPKKEARSCSKELQECVKAAEDALTRSMTRAGRENATVYLQVGTASGIPCVGFRVYGLGRSSG